METILNMCMFYRSSVEEMMISKLTSFYNKTILASPVRIIILMPIGTKPFLADRHKMIYDEIITARFDPTDKQFWNCRGIIKYFYFSFSSLSLDNRHVYLDTGKIFPQLPESFDGDIGVAGRMEDPELMRYVNEKLSIHCDLPPVSDEDLEMYDFSLYYGSEEANKHMQSILKRVLKSYPEYMDTRCVYAIMSCIAAHLKDTLDLTTESYDLTPVDINNSPMVEDFYTII